MSERKYELYQVVDLIGTKRFQGVFTKSELAKIMDGALYRRAPYGEIFETGSRTGWYHVEDDDSWDDEWINPLIELIPIEEED
jgi:hypothetical protein